MSTDTRKQLDRTISLGQVVGTPAVIEDFKPHQIARMLMRHHECDWGNVDDEDWATNNRAVEHGGRLLSAYEWDDDTKVWVITEADRSVTTVLYPKEY